VSYLSNFYDGYTVVRPFDGWPTSVGNNASIAVVKEQKEQCQSNCPLLDTANARAVKFRKEVAV